MVQLFPHNICCQVHSCSPIDRLHQHCPGMPIIGAHTVSHNGSLGAFSMLSSSVLSSSIILKIISVIWRISLQSVTSSGLFYTLGSLTLLKAVSVNLLLRKITPFLAQCFATPLTLALGSWTLTSGCLIKRSQL